MGRYLGIDVGTTATKAAVIETDRADGGAVVARSRVTHSHSRAVGAGRADPTAWANSISDACQALGEQAASVTAIGLSVHCPSAVLFDRHAVPATAAVTWDHPALAAHSARLAEAWTPSDAALNGNRPSPATTMAASLAFFAEQEPEAFRAAPYWGLVGTWLGQWLTGRRGLDPTQASYTGIFAATDGRWAWLPDLAERAGLPTEKLPPITPSLSVLGELVPDVAGALGLPAGIPVLMGSADTPAASYALGGRPHGSPMFIMGTTHVVSNCLDAPDLRAIALQRADVRPGQWLINGVTNGGDALALAARLLGYGESAAAVEGLIEDAWSADLGDMGEAPYFVPHVVPERGPLWLAEPRTALIGMLRTTSVRSAARGVVEGVLFADRMVIESCVRPDQGALVLMGAFGADVALPQLMADSTQRTIEVVDESHLPAIGAAEMCAEVLEGVRLPVLPGRSVRPRAFWAGAVGERWDGFLRHWERVVGQRPPSGL